MCQLLGLSSKLEMSAHFLLSGFFQRAGNTDAHSDGWGVALFHGDSVDIRTDTEAAFTCNKANELLVQQPKASTIIGHIRKATYGRIAPENTHPFTRTLWNKQWVFSHNGDLHNFHPRLRDEFQPRGDTDSERAFGVILQHWQDQFGDEEPSYEQLADSLSKTAQGISEYGNFNILLSNGEWLFVHCSSELYWTAREFPYGRIELVDSEISIDLNQLNDANDKMVVIVTHPLTRGEAWYPMGRGEIHVYKSGELLYHIEPKTLAAPSAEGWESAFEQGRIQLF